MSERGITRSAKTPPGPDAWRDSVAHTFEVYLDETNATDELILWLQHVDNANLARSLEALSDEDQVALLNQLGPERLDEVLPLMGYVRQPVEPEPFVPTEPRPLPGFVTRMLTNAAERLPADLRDQYADDWRVDGLWIDGYWARLRWAVGVRFWSVRRLRRVHEPAAVPPRRA